MAEYNLTVTKFGMDVNLDIPALKGEKSLRKIDEFTTRFENQVKMMFYLSDNDVIRYDDTQLTPMIKYNVAGFPHKMNILYAADRPYLDEIAINERIISLSKKLIKGLDKGNLSFEDKEKGIDIINRIIALYHNHPLYKQYMPLLTAFLSDLENDTYDTDRSCKFEFALMVILDTELSDISRKDREKRDNYRSVRTLGHMLSEHDKRFIPSKENPILRYENLMIPGFEELYEEAVQRSRKKDPKNFPKSE